MRASHSFVFVVTSLLAACGGAESGASTGDAGYDAAEVHYGDGGCIDAVEGAACTSGETACMPAGDPCCIGYVWQCDASTGTWKKLGLGCACMPDDTGTDGAHDTDASDATDAHDAFDAGPFACGATLTCAADQICLKRSPGVATDGGPDYYYECGPIPSACSATPTCDCIEKNVDSSCIPDGCTVDAGGHVTVGCMGV